MNLPVQFPRDPYCRAISRVMLTVDAESGGLFLGVTPDGGSFGRDMLSKITAWADEKELTYTCDLENNKVVLRTEKGKAEFAISMPNKLVIEAAGISLMLGNGKAAGLFMGGGSAVDDAAEGALYVTSGVRLRAIARKGSTEVRSAWDLDALSDPNPQVFIHPDETGCLKAVIFETDFDEVLTDDGQTVDEAAESAAEEFEAFLQTLKDMPEGEEALHAAYIIWTTIQPARVFNQQCITTPEYVSNRRSDGTALLYDNVLLSAFLKEPAAAAERMCSFLKYAQADGLLPKTASNRRFLYEAELPMFGVALAARNDVCDVITEPQYEAMKKAFGWWKANRFCEERGLFYFLHRYEPGCGKKFVFADNAPEFAPELNTYFVLWLDALVKIAGRLGKQEDAVAFSALAIEVTESLRDRLYDGKAYIFKDITDEKVCAGHPAAVMPALLKGSVPVPEITEELPAVYALPLLLAAPEEIRKGLRDTYKGKEIHSLKQAMLALAAAM